MTSGPHVLPTGSLHASVVDPLLDTMTFLNEITSRYPAAVSFGPGRPYDEHFDVAGAAGGSSTSGPLPSPRSLVPGSGTWWRTNGCAVPGATVSSPTSCPADPPTAVPRACPAQSSSPTNPAS